MQCALTIRDLEGNEYPLQATHEVPQELNGNQSLEATIEPKKANQQFIAYVSEMWTIIDGIDTEYRIIYCKRQGAGSSLTVNVKAIPVFFDDFDTQRIYERYDQHMTAQAFFSLIFEGSGYGVVVVDSFYAQDWEGVGDGETRLSAFKRGLERYKAEFRISGNTVYLESQIGRDTQFQYRHRLNASNIVQEIDAGSMYTYARGYGDYEEGQDEDAENNAGLIREYTSPLAAIIGKREAPPIKNGNIKDAAKMDEQLKTLVDESLRISVSSTIHDMRKQGYALAQPEKGDRVFLIDERIGLDEEVRVVDMVPKYDWKGDLLDLKLTFGSEGLSKRHQSNLNAAAKQINNLMAGRAKLPYNVLDAAVKAATKAIQNSMTELQYPENGGIYAVDPENPNLLTRLTSRGLGVSSDGGTTFPDAVTGLGVNTSLLTAGSIHTNNIRIVGDSNYFYWDGEAMIAIDPTDVDKFARLRSDGLYIAKGAMTVERYDGAMFIQSGIPSFDFSVQTSDPPFTNQNVNINGQWYETNSTTNENCQLYTFKHEGRYLNVEVAHRMNYESETTSGAVKLQGLGEWSSRISTTKIFNNTGDSVYHIFQIDLGTPTYERGQFYLQLRTGASSYPAQTRKLRAWMEG